MIIVVNGEEREATPAEEAEILASQQAFQQPVAQAPVSLCTIAGARLVVDQENWEVTGVERSTGIAGAVLIDTDLVYVFFCDPQPDTFYEVMPSVGVTKYNDFVKVSRPGLTELNFIVQRVQ